MCRDGVNISTSSSLSSVSLSFTSSLSSLDTVCLLLHCWQSSKSSRNSVKGRREATHGINHCHSKSWTLLKLLPFITNIEHLQRRACATTTTTTTTERQTDRETQQTETGRQRETERDRQTDRKRESKRRQRRTDR